MQWSKPRQGCSLAPSSQGQFHLKPSIHAIIGRLTRAPLAKAAIQYLSLRHSALISDFLDASRPLPCATKVLAEIISVLPLPHPPRQARNEAADLELFIIPLGLVCIHGATGFEVLSKHLLRELILGWWMTHGRDIFDSTVGFLLSVE